MTSEPRRSPKGFFDGVAGESLFDHPYIAYFRPNELVTLFKQVEGMEDHRLLAIVTALILENRLDHLLGRFFPRYSKLLDADGMTFSMKITVLEALNVIPPMITSAAHVVRKIRNSFAHDLSKVLLTSVESSLLRSLQGQYEVAYGTRLTDGTEEERLVQMFRQLSFYAISGVDSYSTNVEGLRRRISTVEFLDGLERSVYETNETEMKKVLAGGPISTEVQGNLRIERYPGGVVNITSATTQSGGDA